MRIGEFAKSNDVSIDTVRHYMDLGLLLPNKINNQYNFNESSQENIGEIILLKQMGFKLNEIKTIMMFDLIGRMTSFQKDEYYQQLFQNKLLSVAQEINQLESIKENLEGQIAELARHKHEKLYTIGIPLIAIDRLRCIKCGSTLDVTNGEIKDNQVINGELSCHCGVSYTIDDGILMISQVEIEETSNLNQQFISNYIDDTDNGYLDTLYLGIDRMRRLIPFESLQGKTILDLGSGVGFALRNMYHLLPDDCLYLAIDHDINRHKFLKDTLEKSDMHKNILFITTDFKEIPIENNSIDLVIDYSGTSNYSFEHQTFLLDEVDKYMCDKCKLMGTYILFDKFGKYSMIEDKYRENFVLELIKKNIANLNYTKVDDLVSKPLNKGGMYEDYFVEGEVVHFYQYYGQRLG